MTEHVATVHETDEDGRFVLQVNPSTRPFLTFQDKTEAYVLSTGGSSLDVVVGRGESVDVGDVLAGDVVSVVVEADVVTVG